MAETTIFTTATMSKENLPRCLRHTTKNEALQEALYLCIFLQDATPRYMDDEFGVEDIAKIGLTLCFDLLRDKLEIALGLMPWPLADPQTK